MKYDIVIAGVGGQGILTIARLLSMAAASRGLHVKQAEVHGMSQRGGAVYSHLRISDSVIYSDLIPAGQADLIIAIEPLEALRYVAMLRDGGAIVASTNAEVNIPDYPRIEGLLEHVANYPHVAINMEKLARAAGSPLTANVVALGASAPFLPFSSCDYERAIEALFSRKGARIVNANLKAFRFGWSTGTAYLDAINRGGQATSIRSWIENLSANQIGSPDLEFAAIDETVERLSGAESHAVENLLMGAYEEDRKQLYEHEIYRLIELVGAISPPKHVFIPKGSTASVQMLQSFPGERVVVKLVSQDIVHKSDANAVAICSKSLEVVCAEIDALVSRHTATADIAGTLLVEFVEHDSQGLGGELFVGIRATREFGPVIAAGLGGMDTEYLASKMKAGLAVAKAPATETNAEGFLELFKATVAYEVLSGRVRGHQRVVSDAELLRCFRAFISIARRFCVDRGEAGPDIGELEVNPFAFARQRLVPLDGRGRLMTAAKVATMRPRDKVNRLLNPRKIALVGVSSKSDSFGRIVLRNTLRQGFHPSDMFVIKSDANEIEGVKCVSSISDASSEIDLLVVATASESVPKIIREANESGKVHSVIVISGGAGESKGSERIGEEIQDAVAKGRNSANGGVVVLGPNCMGVHSFPARFNTFFVPEEKMGQTPGPASPLAFISQSGAFIVSRLSAMPELKPNYAISLGNQSDVTVSDLLWALAERDDVTVAAIYLEGFSNLDGLETIRAISHWNQIGKAVIVYKAGRSEVGRAAAAGHTASVAGDYDVCDAALRQAGAIVATSFREFGQLVELTTKLHNRRLSGRRVFALTNAGMEAVAIADSLGSQGNAKLLPPSELLEGKLCDVLSSNRLLNLVSVRNPLDLTPMADERCYTDVIRVALQSDEVDVVVVSCIPLAPQLHTLETELAASESFINAARIWLEFSEKPILFVVDAGSDFDALSTGVRKLGIPVFRSADEASSTLATWMAHRLEITEKQPFVSDQVLQPA